MLVKVEPAIESWSYAGKSLANRRVTFLDPHGKSNSSRAFGFPLFVRSFHGLVAIPGFEPGFPP